MPENNDLKKIAIVCDNYKLERFLKKFKESGFDNIKHHPHGNQPVTAISITVKKEIFEESAKRIKKICMENELFFKRGN